MIDFIKQPWPWYVSGPLIGLIVPLLLLLGNKVFGVSSNLRHICAACFPGNISYFKYDWRKEVWNLFFAAGILAGSFIAWNWLTEYEQANINPALVSELNSYGITGHNQIVPTSIVNWSSLFSLKGFFLTIVGGFLVGFGTRYAGGCTSGHSIAGISNLQWPSLVATLCFMAGGFFVANVILPFILKT